MGVIGLGRDGECNLTPTPRGTIPIGHANRVYMLTYPDHWPISLMGGVHVKGYLTGYPTWGGGGVVPDPDGGTRRITAVVS